MIRSNYVQLNADGPAHYLQSAARDESLELAELDDDPLRAAIGLATAIRWSAIFWLLVWVIWKWL